MARKNSQLIINFVEPFGVHDSQNSKPQEFKNYKLKNLKTQELKNLQTMKPETKSKRDTIIKLAIAILSAIAGALGASAMV